MEQNSTFLPVAFNYLSGAASQFDGYLIVKTKWFLATANPGTSLLYDAETHISH